MPLLMCPNDNAPMQTVERSGVQFDMCPTCRGVWLDRGELEKLMSAASDEARIAAPSAPPPQPPAYAPPPQAHGRPWGHDDRRYEQRRDDDYAYRKKKKRMDIFDIFD